MEHFDAVGHRQGGGQDAHGVGERVEAEEEAAKEQAGEQHEHPGGGGKDPGYLIGGEPASLPAASAAGNGVNFVIESCEYDRSFLRLHPGVIVLNNIELDHMDVYGNIEGVVKGFVEFARRLPERGTLFYNADDPHCTEVARRAGCNAISFGESKDALWRLHNIDVSTGFAVADVTCRGMQVGRMQLQVPGRVNTMNALGALAAGHETVLFRMYDTLPLATRKRLRLAGEELVQPEQLGGADLPGAWQGGEDLAVGVEGANIEVLQQISDDYEVLFLQGGATTQFAMIPMNFLGQGQVADYPDTGVWTTKAIKEAKLFGNINVAFEGSTFNYDHTPAADELNLVNHQRA